MHQFSRQCLALGNQFGQGRSFFLRQLYDILLHGGFSLMSRGLCALPGTIASVESYLGREKSVNGSVFLGSVAIKVCRFCDFGSISLPRKPEAASHKNVPVLHVIPVLAANLLWQCGQPLWRSTAILA